jgi:hypothetical protein
MCLKNNFIVHWANKVFYSNVFTLLCHKPSFTASLHTAVTFQTPPYDAVGTLSINFFLSVLFFLLGVE